MYKTEEELNQILEELIRNHENECVEFKEAKNNFDIDKLGKYLYKETECKPMILIVIGEI